jgi:dihydrofolate reductase
MSKLTVQEFVTIDGFAAAPDDALDFMPAGGRTPADPQIERDQLRFIKDEVDTMLLGRTTYQIFIDYWPTATADNEIIADELNALSKDVASRTLDHAPWGDRGDEATIVRDGVEAAAALRRQSGKGVVVWGSLTLAQSLMRAGLVDECQLYLCPSVLGAGKPLFAPDAGLQAMRLLGYALRFRRDSLALCSRGGRPGSRSGIMSVERHSLRPHCRFCGVSFVYRIGG